MGRAASIAASAVPLVIGSNATHARRSHGGTLKITAAAAPDEPEPGSPLSSLPPGGYVCVTVSDTGHGIIRSHRGSITVESTPGVGTTFTINLPAAVPENAAPGGFLARAPGRHRPARLHRRPCPS